LPKSEQLKLKEIQEKREQKERQKRQVSFNGTKFASFKLTNLYLLSDSNVVI